MDKISEVATYYLLDKPGTPTPLELTASVMQEYNWTGMTRDEIFTRVVEILTDSFELDASEITPESTLYEDLDLDSIW
jgi:hypothetical protein